MKSYQLTYLISPDLKERESEIFSQKINDLIVKEGGILKETKKPLKRRLEYPIKKREMAYLTTSNFSLETEKLESLEKKLKSEKQILRYLILAEIPKAPKVPQKIAAKIVKPKEEIISPKIKKAPKKVELKEIEKKLEEILGE